MVLKKMVLKKMVLTLSREGELSSPTWQSGWRIMATLFPGDGFAAGVMWCSGFVGQRYCSLPCRIQARQQQSRSANRHQQSPEGRADHRDWQREYRHRRRIRASVTDQGSTSIASSGRMPTCDARSARTTTEVGFAAAPVQPLTSLTWQRAVGKLDPLFLSCAWCGCGAVSSISSPNPAILGF